jgi:type II secretory ATPase GspE/PulE/Tfp pilus assembly ATPase PilB-like protein
LFRAVGCAACRGRGYRGRLAIHEVIPAEKFLPLIAANAPLADLIALRDRSTHTTLWQRGLAAAAAGETTVEEVARVL